ncbi:hypothetical protein [uncultured Tistrella sp.]|uniref:hypothetical protein n=1 Tax=Tistrella mobilis TaxID=171437 RepID=UPI000C09E8D0|nr:hypothetical protein [uncultured Tistrella sp.]MAM75754.1 hypothetical protein [Tistrella sp.]
MDQHIERITAVARRAAHADDRLRRGMTLHLVILFPTLIALITAFTDDWPAAAVAAAVMLSVASALVAGFIVHTASQGTARVYFDALDLKQIADSRSLAHTEEMIRATTAIRRKDDDLHHANTFLEILSFQSKADLLWMNMVLHHGCQVHPAPTLLEITDEAMKFVVAQRAVLFGMKSSIELFDFAVYLHDPDSGQLHNVWRFKHDQHPGGKVGRSWAIGQGHVGKAFADRCSKVTGDTSRPEASALLATTPELTRSYDIATYRAFASFPIGPATAGDAPIGVLTASSNVVDRFDYGNTEVLRHAALALASLIILTQYQTRRGNRLPPSPEADNE